MENSIYKAAIEDKIAKGNKILCQYFMCDLRKRDIKTRQRRITVGRRIIRLIIKFVL